MVARYNSRMRRRLTAALGALVILYHAWLFVDSARAGHLAEPWLLLRWLAACGLAAGLSGLYRSSGSLVRGKRAVALWVLAALLHAPAVADRAERVGLVALPETAASALELMAECAVAAFAVFLLTGTRRPQRARQSGWELARSHGPQAACSNGFECACSARPPPLA